MAERQSSSRPVWTGSISFGLVTIPVKLFTAVREQRLAFRSLHDQDKVPLKQKLYCPVDGKEVHPEHIVKGFEVEKDKFVVVRQEELEAAAPKATKSIDILDFVQLAEIDPVYFDRPYYVAAGPGGDRPLRLLLAAMHKSDKVGIAKVVMHNKEHLVALRPLDHDTLCMETMHFADEVVATATVPGADMGSAKVDDREMKIAQQLIDSLTAKFDPRKYHDEYREQVMKLIEKKAGGQEVVSRPEPDEKPRKGTDLLAALEASLAKAKVPAAAASHGTNGHAARHAST
ncbi:MAG TPA: Ku protein, partial [Tepidisphaeraceae bacterium]|nr:Ku protein [Tepidisphaeraceae bacterium]